MSCVACHDRSCALSGNVEFFFLGMKGWGGIDGRTEEGADGPDSECDMSGGKEAAKGGTAEHPMRSVCGWGDAVPHMDTLSLIATPGRACYRVPASMH